jgi:hypothetical protein
VQTLTKLEESPKTITGIANIMKAAYRYEIYELGKFFLLHVQDFPEQYPYLIAMSKNKWNAVCCLIWSKNCGSGE